MSSRVVELFKRSIYKILWTVTVRPFPRQTGKKWAICILKMFGAKIGRNCVVYSSAHILYPWNLTLEDNVIISYNTIIQNSTPMLIKQGAMISQYSYLCDGTHSLNDPQDDGHASPIVIEERSWISARCFVGPGVTVKRGTVVGGGTVLKTSTPPYSVVIGNPAKVVGFASTPAEIIEFEKTQYKFEERLSLEILEKNYKRYFLDHIKEIKTFTSIICK